MKLGGSYVDEDSFGDRIGCLYHFADFEIYEKGGAKIEGFVQTVQGILWAVIAFDNWSASSIVLKIAYLLLVVLSLASGIREFCKGNPA